MTCSRYSHLRFTGFSVLCGTLAARGIPPDRSLNVRHRQALSRRGKHPPGRNEKRRAPTMQKAQAKHALCIKRRYQAREGSQKGQTCRVCLEGIRLWQTCGWYAYCQAPSLNIFFEGKVLFCAAALSCIIILSHNMPEVKSSFMNCVYNFREHFNLVFNLPVYGFTHGRFCATHLISFLMTPFRKAARVFGGSQSSRFSRSRMIA